MKMGKFQKKFNKIVFKIPIYCYYKDISNENNKNNVLLLYFIILNNIKSNNSFFVIIGC